MAKQATLIPDAPPPAAAENRPVHDIRHRRIRATIWRNATSNGPMYTVTMSRSFKQGEEWKDSQSFGYDDILVVAKLMYDAHSFISALRAEEAATTVAKKEKDSRGK